MPTAEEQKIQDDAAAKAAADTAAKTAADAAAAAGSKTPEQIAADAAKADQVSKDAAKAAADAKAAEDAAKAGKVEELKAPDKYELKVPENAIVDATDVARIEKLARENNLPNDMAQSMLETTNAVIAEQSAAWRTELEADKTYGGDKLAETQQLGNLALDRIAPKGTPHGDGLRRLLSRGVGNNLYVAAALATIGRMTKEDTTIAGDAGGDATRPKSLAEQLYPNAAEFKKS